MSSNSGEKGAIKKKKVEEKKKEEEKRDESMEEGSSGELSSDSEAEEFDPFLSMDIFDEKVGSMPIGAWVGSCRELMVYCMEIAADVAAMRKKQPTPCKVCKSGALALGNLAAIQMYKCDKALSEYERRYLQAIRDLKAERAAKRQVVAQGLAMCEELQGRVLKAAEEKEAWTAEELRLATNLLEMAEKVAGMEQEREIFIAAIDEKEEQLRAALAAKEEETRERERLRAALAQKEEQLRAALEKREQVEETSPPCPRGRKSRT